MAATRPDLRIRPFIRSTIHVALMILGTLAWWVLVGYVGELIRSRHDVFDHRITHMGSEAEEFWFVSLFWGLVVVPGFVIPGIEALRHRFTPYLLGIAAPLIVVGVLAAYAGSVLPPCTLVTHEGEGLGALTLLVFGAILPFGTTVLLSSQRGRVRHAPVSIALAISTGISYLAMALFGPCTNPSKRITTGIEAVLFIPVLMVIAYPAAIIGGWLGHRSRVSSEAREGPANLSPR